MKSKFLVAFLSLLCVFSLGASVVALAATAASGEEQPDSYVVEIDQTKSGGITNGTQEAAILFKFISSPQEVKKVWDPLGINKFAWGYNGKSGLKFVFSQPVDSSVYKTLTFNAHAWSGGGYTDISVYNATQDYSSLGTAAPAQTVKIYHGYDGKAETSVVLDTAALADENGMVGGFLLYNAKNSAANYHWGISDVTAKKSTDKTVLIDMAKSETTRAEYGYKLSYVNELGISKWTEFGIHYNGRMLGSGAIAVRFAEPLDAAAYPIIEFDAARWSGEDEYHDVGIYKLSELPEGTALKDHIFDSNHIVQKAALYGTHNGKNQLDTADLRVRVYTSRIADETGKASGFILSLANSKCDHFGFSSLTAIGGPLAEEEVAEISAERSSTTSEWADGTLQTQDNTGIGEPWSDKGIHYNGRDLGRGSVSVRFRFPLDANVYKSLTFHANTWNGADALIDAYIYKLTDADTVAQTVQVWAACNTEGDTQVVLDTAALADENGFVDGFVISLENALEEGKADAGTHFGFSDITASVQEMEYSVTFQGAGENGADKTLTYTRSTADELTPPPVPEKEHYTGEWPEYKLLERENIAVEPVYTAIEYTITFKTEQGETAVKYTAEKAPVAPEVPAKEHYDGAWEAYEPAYDNEQIVNAVYTATEYSVTFKADGAQDTVVKYTAENKDSFLAPQVPAKEHYDGVWEAYELQYSKEQVVNAKYTAIEYTITFKTEEGETAVKYTVEKAPVAPEVPAKEGFEGAWEEYELQYNDTQVVNAVYTEIPQTGCSGEIGVCGGMFAAVIALAAAALILKKAR